jgi:hypothetical protein
MFAAGSRGGRRTHAQAVDAATRLVNRARWRDLGEVLSASRR